MSTLFLTSLSTTLNDHQPNPQSGSVPAVYQTAFALMEQGFCLMEKVDTDTQQPPDFRFRLVNPAFEKHTGLQNVIGKTIRQLVPGAEERTMAIYEQVAVTGQPTQFETYVAQWDRWLAANVFRISPQPAQLVVLFTDITQRKRVEDVLRDSQARLQVALGAAQLGTFIWHVAEDYTEEDALARVHFGLPPDGTVSLSEALVTTFHPEDAPRYAAAVARATDPAGPGQLHETFRVRLPDGQLRWLSVSATTTFEGTPPVAVRLTGVLADATERQQENQRQHYRLRLTDALRALSSPDQLLGQALTLVGEYLELDRVTYNEIDPGVTRYTVRANYVREGVSSNVGVYPMDPFNQTVQHLRRGQTFIVPDAQDESFSLAERAIHQQMQVGAYVTVPLVKNGRWLCNLVAHSGQPRPWGSAEIALLEETAERIWAAVERARAEEALRASQERFESIANLVPDLLWDSQPAGASSWYNQRWLDYTGQRFEEAIDWGWTQAIHPDDRQASARHYREAVETGQSLRQEHRIRRHDGAYRWFVVSTSPRKDESGQVVNMYGAATDIHDHKCLEATLREADRRKDEFLAMLAHELRNPLATLGSGLSILDLTITDEQTRSTAAMMSRQTGHLVRMVDDLLDVSRISRGKIELKKERVDLVDLVSQAVESVRPLYQQQHRSLQVDLPAAPIYLAGDATRLSQVVTNLLTNGVRYTSDGGQVWLSLQPQTGPSVGPATGRQEAVLEVKDDGIGLAADQLGVIFELFVQVDNSLARSKGGLGLGLTLVKRLVELHAGRVEAQSEGVGTGSTFRVYLPTLPPVPQVPPTPAPRAPDSATAPRILIIDDNADAGITLAMLLKLKGYEAHSQTSGRAGIEAAAALQPWAILLDIGMPEMDGYETCRAIRQQSWGGAMPIIALTGYGQAEDRQRTKGAGFNGHLVKPVDLGELTRLLTDLLAKGQSGSGLG